MSGPLRIVVGGQIAQYPLGGVAWDYVQYPVGLARLGHDVLYVEDTETWPYNPREGGVSESCDANVEHLARTMSRFGLADAWAYRFPWQDRWYGRSKADVAAFVRKADVVLNVSGVLARPREYRPRSGVLAYVDTDPGFTQVKLARGQLDFRAQVDAHDVHFSFGETLATSLAPDTGHAWRATRQPVVLDEWRADGSGGDRFTTVMNWTSYRSLRLGGLRLGQKDEELTRFLDLPRAVAPVRLELAVAAGKTRRTPRGLLERHGWTLVDPDAVAGDLGGYRRYVAGSRGEWSVAKNGYVTTRCGWFSCRSACYLAAGRPVVVQDTGFSDVLPVGDGLLAFRTTEEAAAGIRAVEADYGRHAAAARDLAARHFDSDAVLGKLIADALRGG